MLKLSSILFLISLGASPLALGLESSSELKNPLTAQVQLTPFEVGAGQIAQIEAKISLPAGYRAYEDQFKISIQNPEGFQISGFQVSPVSEGFDKFTKKTKKFVTDSAVLTAPIQIPDHLPEGDQKFILSITYQACTNSFCLFPQTTNIDVHFKLLKSSQDHESQGFFQTSFKEIYKQGLAWTFLFVFVFGFLTSFTPCVYPMIPITLAILGREAHARTRLQTFLVSLSYVAGIALTFSALGVFAASTGVLFGSFMASPWILGFICLVFFSMALSMLGVFELQAPQFLRDGLLSHLHLHGYLGAFISGLLAGIVASPCVGPVLVGVLTLVAQSKSLWLGFWLLFTYAIGMGLIFLALGLSTSMTKFLPKSGGWTNKIKVFFAVMMFGASLYYLDQLLLTAKLTNKSYFSFANLKTVNQSKPGFALDLIDWKNYSPAVLEQAKKEQKPLLIDFRADI
jgi:thiol:disulfide interchange protein DsbD